MFRTVIALIFILVSLPALTEQSSITESDGSSCMGDDKSRKQTENAALQEAKRLAVEFSKTYIESETVVENYELKADLVKAFARADVRVLDVLERHWDDPETSDCFTIRIKAEVVPSSEVMSKVNTEQMMADPRAPLNVRVWTDSDTYTAGELMTVYLQANKPFYGRLLYTDAQGNNIQLLPNEHRSDNYFAGGTIFEVPAGRDRFQMEVGEPFGKEKLTLYGSTNPLGGLSTQSVGLGLSLVNDSTKQIAAKTRGISITPSASAGTPGKSPKKRVAEFAEATANVTTAAGA